MRNFEGGTAVVTGGGGGIGEAPLWRLASLGMRLVVADVDASAARRVQSALAAAGHRAIAVTTDVAAPDQVERLAEAAYEAFGSVDVLCNNAGIVPSGRYRPVWEYPLEDWDWAFGVNLMGVVHGLRSFVPRMLAAGREGHILNTASVAGFVSGAGSPVYSASKHAVVRVTEALYAALIERNAPIGVTLLSPGLVNTRIYDSERNRPEFLRPKDGIAPESAELEALATELYSSAMLPDEVAGIAVDAIRHQRFYAFTTDSFDTAIRDRTDAVLGRRNPCFEGLLALTQRDLANRQTAAQ